MTDKDKAIAALKKIASTKAEKKIAPIAKKKTKATLKDLGIPEENAAKTAATIKVLHDLSQGKMELNAGDFSLGADISPKEKKLKLGYKKRF